MFDLSRRDLMRVGMAGLAGLASPNLLRAGTHKAKAKRVIFLHQWGGPSQFETFDMKPNAPSNIAGTFKPIASKNRDLQVCEMLPRCAEVADKFSVLRGISHTMKNHNSAGYYSLTGFAPPTDDQRLRDSIDLFPAYGSVVDKFAPADKGVPTFVSYPHQISDGSVTPGQHASFLGKIHNPLFVGQDPNSPQFRLPELTLPSSMSLGRLESRREMLRLIDRQANLLERSAVAQGMDETYQRAVAMLTSPGFKRAFDLSQESKEVRDSYGRTTYGQGCLLARRLVEAGAKFVTVYFAQSIGGQDLINGWDTHGFGGKKMDPILKQHLLPITDQTLPTLLLDLEKRGLLDETLVVWMGEFGRSPKINGGAGRDHWPQCYPALFAGGGVKRGAVVGSSDKTGTYPGGAGYKIEDVSATIYSLLGIDPETEMRDRLGRPFPVSRGDVIKDLIA